MLKKLAFCVLCLIAQSVLSESYVDGMVTVLSVGTTYARIQADEIVSAEKRARRESTSETFDA